jgi:SAM-dependent MidA family methyltransferase
MGASADPATPGASLDLLPELSRAAQTDGFLPFDRYMEVVLYSEPHGYYSSARTPLGTPGDFYTAAHVSPLFSAALASRFADVRRRLGPGRPCHLVDLGAGDGTLLAGMLRALAATTEGATGLDVVVVERTRSMRALALERVSAAAQPLRASVRATDSFASLGPVDGVVVANELLDAQPVRRLERRGEGWVELGVRLSGGRVVPAEGVPARPIPSPPLPAQPPEGTILEVSPSAEALVREVADHLVHGLLLVDDYGMEERELVAGHPGGTLATVRGHREGGSPLEAPGAADLSAFVNFTRVRAAAARSGLAVLSDRSQAEALGEWGFPRLLERAVADAGSEEQRVRLRLQAKNLLFGFERFRVLELVPSLDRVRWGLPT